MLSVRSPVDQPHSQTFSQILCASQWDQQIAYCPTSSARFTSIYHDCNHKQNNNQKIILWKKSIHSSKYLFSITCATWSTCSPRIVNFCTQWRTSCASAKYELLVNPATCNSEQLMRNLTIQVLWTSPLETQEISNYISNSYSEILKNRGDTNMDCREEMKLQTRTCVIKMKP